jgi:hypothetical protein
MARMLPFSWFKWAKRLPVRGASACGLQFQHTDRRYGQSIPSPAAGVGWSHRKLRAKRKLGGEETRQSELG